MTPKPDRALTNLPVEEIAHYPLPGMAFPASLAFSPDDRLVSYLYSPERSLTRQLFAFDPASGVKRLLFAPPEGGTNDGNVSLEEALRRERMRQREVWHHTICLGEWESAPVERLLRASGMSAMRPSSLCTGW